MLEVGFVLMVVETGPRLRDGTSHVNENLISEKNLRRNNGETVITSFGNSQNVAYPIAERLMWQDQFRFDRGSIRTQLFQPASRSRNAQV
jgi:hypothetical protein